MADGISVRGLNESNLLHRSGANNRGLFFNHPQLPRDHFS